MEFEAEQFEREQHERELQLELEGKLATTLLNDDVDAFALLANEELDIHKIYVCQEGYEWSAIHYAIEFGAVNTVRFLLSKRLFRN